MTTAQICLDCPAKVSGSFLRCDTCVARRTRQRTNARKKKFRARKKAGKPPASNALAPAGGAVTSMSRMEAFLANYDAVEEAVMELSTIPDWKAFTARAAFVQDFANRAENREMEINAARARLVMQNHLGFMLIDMEESGELRRHGHSKGGGSGAEPPPPTLQDLKISKKLSMKSKNYARMDDFDAQLADWKHRQEEEAGSISLTIHRPTQKTPRKPNDAYMSPHCMIFEVCARWKPTLPGKVVEPCCGDGFFADRLEEAGHEVLRSDITTGQDFFKLTKAPALKLCTNPPFKCFDEDGAEIKGQRIRDFITHAFAIGFVEVAMIIPERMFACGEGFEFINKHKPAVFAQMDWRKDYLGKGGQADRMLGVAIWTSPCAERCDYEIWSRENGRARA